MSSSSINNKCLVSDPDLKPFLESLKTSVLNIKEFRLSEECPVYFQLLKRCGLDNFQKTLIEKQVTTIEELENFPEWKKFEQKVSKLFKQTALVHNESPLEWLHGTRSPSLIGINRVAQESFSMGKHLLVPTGTLVAHNFAPSTGELSWGIMESGCNHQHLSVVSAQYAESAAHYSNEVNLYYDLKREKDLIEMFCNYSTVIGFVRLKIAILRLLLSSDTTPEDKEWIKKKLDEILNSPQYSQKAVSTWKNFAHLIGTPFDVAVAKENSPLLRGEPVGVPRSSGSKTWGIIIDKNEKEQLCHILLEKETTKWVPFNLCNKPHFKTPPEIKAPIETLCLLEQRIDPKPAILELKALCDSVKPCPLSEVEKGYFEKSFPILWGAKKIPETRLRFVKSDIPGDKAVFGSLALGEEIIYAFTKKRDLPRLSEWLHASSLKVYPMTTSAAYFLAAFAHFQSKRWV